MNLWERMCGSSVQSQDEAEVEAVRLAKEEGMIPIPPFDHLHVIAGQGMIDLKLL